MKTVLLLLTSPAFLLGQTTLTTDHSPDFEVASIHECRGGDPSGRLSWSPGNLRLPCWPLRRLLQEAFDVFKTGAVDPFNPSFPLTPLEGGPAWINSVRYTIQAKSSNSETGAMMRGPMMQRLLQARFQLSIKKEVRDSEVYLMSLVKGGKLVRTTPDSCKILDPSDGTQSLKIQPNEKPFCVEGQPSRVGSQIVWDVKGMSLAVFSQMIHPGLPVVDRTGLDGRFDIHLEFSPDNQTVSEPNSNAPSEPPGTGLIAAMRQQLGLRLDRGRAPREFLVITHIAKPVPN